MIFNHQSNLFTEQQFKIWVAESADASAQGTVPHYIPQLYQVNPQAFAAQMLRVDNQCYMEGSIELPFALMSVIKPFLLLYLLLQEGAERVFDHVGILPSDDAFNSLEQLQKDQGFPRNPMINSGAITLASFLPGKTATERCKNLRLWLNQYADCQLFLDESLLESVESLPNPKNRAIAAELERCGVISNAEIALETYNQICCLSGTIFDLSKLGMLLVNAPHSNWLEACCTVKALMMTCGLYQASGRFAVRVGLPTKSGVSGAVLSIIPRHGVIACYSPPLDEDGNSVGGLCLIEKIARALKLSVFN